MGIITSGGVQADEFMIGSAPGHQQAGGDGKSVVVSAVPGDFEFCACFCCENYNDFAGGFYFMGNEYKNGYYGVSNAAESVSMTSASAQYLKYDPATGEITLFWKAWTNYMTGKWMWVLIPRSS